MEGLNAPARSAMAARIAASWGLSSLVSLMAWIPGSLDQHFAEQDILDLHRLRRDAQTQQKFLAQPVDAGRPAQILQPEFPQVDLKVIDDARHDFLDLGKVLFPPDLHAEADLEETGTTAGAVQVDHHVGDFEEHTARSGLAV